MVASRARIEANARYSKKAYERIAFTVRRDAGINGDFIRAHASEMGESMNGFLKRAVEETIERDKSKLE